jgi:DNA-binding IclR family transcriptional regulator
VRNFENQVVAGISVSAPVIRLTKQKIEDIIRCLKDISVKASREMGWDA